MNAYQKRKAAARNTAIAWQYETSSRAVSCSELAEATAYFTRLGKRYGLLREFRENAII